MYRIQCGEIWGGFQEQDQDLCSGGITASLFSSASSGRVGGDVYYLSVCGADQLTRIALADVVGHGAPVSDVAGWLYEALEQRLNDHEGSQVLAQLNQLALDRGIRSMATAALAGFVISDAGAHFSYAGHAPALVNRAGSKTWEPAALAPGRESNPNPPLGVVPNTRYDDYFYTLGPGDRLFLYTDGLVEGRDAKGEIFGYERLLGVLHAEASAPLHELKRSVLAELQSHSPQALQQDDVSLIAVEVRPG